MVGISAHSAQRTTREEAVCILIWSMNATWRHHFPVIFASVLSFDRMTSTGIRKMSILCRNFFLSGLQFAVLIWSDLVRTQNCLTAVQICMRVCCFWRNESTAKTVNLLVVITIVCKNNFQITHDGTAPTAHEATKTKAHSCGITSLNATSLPKFPASSVDFYSLDQTTWRLTWLIFTIPSINCAIVLSRDSLLRL